MSGRLWGANLEEYEGHFLKYCEHCCPQAQYEFESIPLKLGSMSLSLLLMTFLYCHSLIFITAAYQRYSLLYLPPTVLMKIRSFLGWVGGLLLLNLPPGCACANSTSKAPGFGGLCLLWHQFWSALTAPEWRLAEQTADRV